jgi:hypothetical protein
LATATQAEVRAAIIDQRRRALWLTGTHLGDIRRYNISLTPAEGTAYHAGGTYGPSVGQNVCLPLPDVESFNNPVIGG